MRPLSAHCLAAPPLALRTSITKGEALAKPNFQFQKRQRELEKKRKQEEKRLRKQERNHAAPTSEPPVPAAAEDIPPQ
jgi:hypothetical protein